MRASPAGSRRWRSPDRALELQPDYDPAWVNRGIALRRLGRLDEALGCYDAPLARDPHHVEALANRAAVLSDLGRQAEAIDVIDRALGLRPGQAALHLNRAAACIALGRFEEALRSCDSALALQPRLAPALLARASAYLNLQRLTDAARDMARARELQPDNADVNFNLGCLYLALGDFERGWPLYEWRNRRREIPRIRRFAAPAWDGIASPEGRELFVYTDQGLGDALLFARYLAPLAAQGAQLTVAVQGVLMRLFARNFPGVTLLAEDATPQRLDLHCALSSLAGLQRALPGGNATQGAYLRADSADVARWEQRLSTREQSAARGPGARRPRIGLCWATSTGNANGRSRSLGFAALAAQLPSDGHYVSLQKEIPAGDAALLTALPGLSTFQDALHDFCDTAALCACLDLIISIDTSVANLCGALGLRTWVLVPYQGDWKWMTAARASPWYPTATLFRQARPDDWSEPLAQLRAELRRGF